MTVSSTTPSAMTSSSSRFSSSKKSSFFSICELGYLWRLRVLPEPEPEESRVPIALHRRQAEEGGEGPERRGGGASAGQVHDPLQIPSGLTDSIKIDIGLRFPHRRKMHLKNTTRGTSPEGCSTRSPLRTTVRR